MGPKRAELLDKNLGIRTYYDMLYHFPTHYVDRTSIRTVAELQGAAMDDMPSVQLKGRFVTMTVQGEGARQRLVGLFTDGTGTMVPAHKMAAGALPHRYGLYSVRQADIVQRSCQYGAPRSGAA